MLRPFWVTLCVDLYSPVRNLDDRAIGDLPRAVVGYFRNFGVTATSEQEAQELAARDVIDGDIRWAPSEAYLVRIDELPSPVVDRSGDWTELGIWYRSGRVFFPAN